MTLRFTHVAPSGVAYVVAELDEATQQWLVTVTDVRRRPIVDQELRDAAVAHAHARISALRLHLWHVELRRE